MPGLTATFRSVHSGLRRRAQTSPHPADDDRRRGTCSYYPADISGCRAPRSCYDCLNSELEKEPDGCIINEVGRCVSIAGNYDVSLDFRVVVSSDISNERSPINSQKVTQPPRNLTDQHTIHIELEFPAVNTSYCEANDALFSADQLAGGGFIYGTEGCVFIEVCEIPSWVYVVGGSDCFGLSAADYNDPSEENHGDGNGDNPQVFWCVAIAIILTLVAALAMVITIHHKPSMELQRRRTSAIGQSIASSSRIAGKSGALLLNLFGWESMRADLIEKERQEMQNRICIQPCPVIENNSLPGFSPSANYLQLVGVEPSAPVMSPINSSAPRFTDS
ncbi:hypothetical protein PI124_g15054 [Phytophthora idaei]|nr:hypothetical protein PI125_g14669 [Phytophthora idaei]KAG3145257.1 hypothetical protein PI126_g13799 [Phytophthora idaei]KAG3240034.1 hypothetical protein PI124_g15054 [Phytophthora idaei]